MGLGEIIVLGESLGQRSVQREEGSEVDCVAKLDHPPWHIPDVVLILLCSVIEIHPQ